MLTIRKSRLEGEVVPPPSKSVTHRAYIIASLTANGSKVKNPLHSEDTDATFAVLAKMGMKSKTSENTIVIDQPIRKGAGEADCRNSGTTLRLLTAVNAAFPEKTILTGDDSLITRPISDLVDSLHQLGADIKTRNGFPPVIIERPIAKEKFECTLNPSKSSQFLSALLILGAIKENGIQVSLEGTFPSRPYVAMTVQMLSEAGAKINTKERVFEIIKPLPQEPVEFNVPADFSSAAFYIVAGALPGNSIMIKGIDRRYPQADSAIIDLVRRFGADIEETPEGIRVSHHELVPQEIDLADSPDLFPILGVLAAFTEGKTTIYGASHLKYKETNRIKTTGELVRKLGASFVENEDGAIIEGRSTLQGGEIVDSYGDHRIAMAAAIAATQAERGLRIRNWQAASVSYRDFYLHLKAIGGKIKEE
ncbi:MAG: 3-phosphoshikimate 1-carboxyvinyltransferase [Methanobacteriota archaeon]|nr:MAG: 3-phosphoshikimate 1-carboxyvinyltransferase [Euryarchaeota archaeon]